MGSTWPNLSSTPCTSKSGEHEVHTAPKLAVASIDITVSGMLGKKPATLSPFLTPFCFNQIDNLATCLYNSKWLSEVFRLSSAQKTMAGLSLLSDKRFFAKLSLASGNHSEPKKSSLFFNTSVGGFSPMIEEYLQNRPQKDSGNSHDHWCSS